MRYTQSPKNISLSLVTRIDTLPSNTIEQSWFAMRATYHRETAVKSLLDLHKIDNYLPMTQKLKVSHGRKVRVMSPLVSSLIFVYCDKDRLQQFKARVPHLQYMTMPVNGKKVPIVVPQSQMDNFVKITSQSAERFVFYKPDELDLEKGTLVKIHGGAFDGISGMFMKVAGKRNRRVVVELQGVITVAVECSDANFVEVL